MEKIWESIPEHSDELVTIPHYYAALLFLPLCSNAGDFSSILSIASLSSAYFLERI
jgi:hypothetical protein